MPDTPEDVEQIHNDEEAAPPIRHVSINIVDMSLEQINEALDVAGFEPAVGWLVR